jgi:hypothetical protein
MFVAVPRLAEEYQAEFLYIADAALVPTSLEGQIAMINPKHRVLNAREERRPWA